MRISFVSIFPEIYQSFLQTSLLHRAIEKDLLICECVNPRDFCTDKHQQIDDVIYGGGAGMLMKAKPLIDAVESIIHAAQLRGDDAMRKVIYMSPSQTVFNQHLAYNYSTLHHIVLVSGRYEGIDARFEEYMTKNYPQQFIKLSMGRFITLGGEFPSMVFAEAVARLVPGVIKEVESHLIESYDPTQQMQNLEYPQYTRPEELLGMKVPEVLLSGHHAEIEKWRARHTETIT